VTSYLNQQLALAHQQELLRQARRPRSAVLPMSSPVGPTAAFRAVARFLGAMCLRQGGSRATAVAGRHQGGSQRAPTRCVWPVA
jgi:hypothetical protein